MAVILPLEGAFTSSAYKQLSLNNLLFVFILLLETVMELKVKYNLLVPMFVVYVIS